MNKLELEVQITSIVHGVWYSLTRRFELYFYLLLNLIFQYIHLFDTYV